MRPRSLVFPMIMVFVGLWSIVTLRSIEPTYGLNQLLFFLTSFMAYFLVSSVPFIWWRKTHRWWYLGVVLLLALTLLVGRATNGSVAWLRFGAYRLQPSELLKPALMLFLAVLTDRGALHNWRHIMIFGLWVAAPLSLILLQPDLGSALVILAGVMAVFLANRPPARYIWTGLIATIITLSLAWVLWLQPYQKARILTFLNPQHDPLGSGYNARQALIAVGSGHIWGQGIGNGLQSNLRFLPERQTDFLFATFAEETGLVGTGLLLGAYTSLVAAMIGIIPQMQYEHQARLTLGLWAMFLAQITVNIGMNIGLLPITGLTLPLFSLGGSSLLATGISLGLIESARRSSLPPQPVDQDNFRSVRPPGLWYNTNSEQKVLT